MTYLLSVCIDGSNGCMSTRDSIGEKQTKKERNHLKEAWSQLVHLPHFFPPSSAREVLLDTLRVLGLPPGQFFLLRPWDFSGNLKKYLRHESLLLTLKHKKHTINPTWINQLNSYIMWYSPQCFLYISGIHKAQETEKFYVNWLEGTMSPKAKCGYL